MSDHQVLLDQQLADINDRMKMAWTSEEREAIFGDMKGNPQLFNAFLRQNNEPQPFRAPIVYAPRIEDQSDIDEKLAKIGDTLTSSGSYMDKDAALAELKKTPVNMKEFLRKNMPPSEELPVLQTSPIRMEGLFIPRADILYREELAVINNAIRAARTKEERDAVFNQVVAKPHLLQEFLKRNIPRFFRL